MICSKDKLVWRNCYSGQFDLWSPESYSHPAKMSVALCFRIIEHLEEIGLLQKGDTILDPMAGIGTTGLCSAIKGYPSVMVELEDKFIDLSCDNYLCPGIPHYTVKEEILPAEKAGWRTVPTDDIDLDTDLPIERTYWQKALPERKKYRVHSECRCHKSDWHGVHRVYGNKGRLQRKLRRELPITIIKGDARQLSSLLQE